MSKRCGTSVTDPEAESSHSQLNPARSKTEADVPSSKFPGAESVVRPRQLFPECTRSKPAPEDVLARVNTTSTSEVVDLIGFVGTARVDSVANSLLATGLAPSKI